MEGDRVEAVVDTGQGTRTFEITASRAGRRLEVTSGRGIVEVTEVTRHGTPVRTGRFMANRLIALVEHPALEAGGTGVDVSTRRRLGGPTEAVAPVRRAAAGRRPRQSGQPPEGADPADERADGADEGAALEREEEAASEPDPADRLESIGA